MTRNELHVLARQAMRDTNTNGDDTLTPWMVRFVERFGQLVAEEEREACAEWLESGLDLAGLAGAPEMQRFTVELLLGCAHAIRVRGEA